MTGTIERLSLQRGEDLPGDRTGGERAVVVLRGSVRWDGGDLYRGDGVYGSCRLTTVVDAELLVLHSGHRATAERTVAWQFEVAGRGTDGTLAATGGFTGMGVRWLATAETVGSTGIVVATSIFEPAGHHDEHRHPNAEEFFFVLEGGGYHLAAPRPVRMGPGELVRIPAGEWHGFRTDPGTTTTALYGYLGVGSLAEAGYELGGAG